MPAARLLSIWSERRRVASNALPRFSRLVKRCVLSWREIEGEEIFLRGLYYIEETGTYIKDSIRGNRRDAAELGASLAKIMKESCSEVLCSDEKKTTEKERHNE